MIETDATILGAEAQHELLQIAKISALQIEYSPWTTEIEQSKLFLPNFSLPILTVVLKDGILHTARELGIPIVAYSPLGRGFLTVSYTTHHRTTHEIWTIFNRVDSNLLKNSSQMTDAALTHAFLKRTLRRMYR